MARGNRTQQIINLRGAEDGLTSHEIAEMVGCHASYVREALNRHHMPLAGNMGSMAMGRRRSVPECRKAELYYKYVHPGMDDTESEQLPDKHTSPHSHISV